MKKELIEFKCDDCGQQALIAKNNNEIEYPYKDGWLYLYKFNGNSAGVEKPLRFDEEDKHFCREKCMFRYMSKVMNDLKSKKDEENPKNNDKENFKEAVNRFDMENF